MAKKKSPITGNPATPAFKKHDVQYYTDELNNIFCKELDQSNMVGGGNEIPRNADDVNEVRLQRIRQITNNMNPKILDYGCGNGLMVKFMQDKGVDCTGYDRFVIDTHLTTDNDCVTLTEVIEHLTAPFSELSEVYNALKPGGKVMIETSFSNWLTEHDDYIDPRVGHCTIFSHEGLDYLMKSKGFTPSEHINKNVRVYVK